MTSATLLDAIRAALGAQFVVERPIGTGAMGTVVLARDLTLDRPVAVKVVNPELAASRSFRDRFLQEARTVAKLRHHNLVTVHAAGEAGGLLFAVMEYVPGESLRERLDREGPLPADEAARLLHELAVALAYAHAQGVVHRDLKPENVLLDRETGRALLADFGVAQALAAGDADDERATSLHHAVGSPRYMSPEQAAGERRVDGRSDLYALGVVGYEMLAGAPPFAGPGVQALLAQHITAPLPSLAERAPTAPAPLVHAIERALAKDPAQRHADAAAMARAIAAATRGDDARGTGERRGAWPRRWKVMAGALAVAAGVGAGLAVWTGRGAEPANAVYLVAPFEVLDDDPELAWLRRGSVNMLALDLAQWEDLRVVDYPRTLDLLRDAGLDSAARIGLSDAQRLARTAGAGTIVMGQVRRTGDSLLVVAALYDAATGSRGLAADAAAPLAADPRGVFDEVARELLQLAGAPTITPDLASTTTQSLAAYRDYLRGVEALNSWALVRAESLFTAAVRADSTFALAHYKRALAYGWRRTPDTSDVRLAETALRHASRLGARDRALVDGYVSMVRGLAAVFESDFETATTSLDAAIDRYGALVARDSMDAESWYVLGDAHFHRGTADTVPPAREWTAALRAFDRTLALDSTFHLAYSHKLAIYQAASTAGSPLVVVGDSVLAFVGDSAARAFGAPRIAEARRQARAAAIAEARGWAAADPDAGAAQLALAEAYAAAAEPARAAQTLRTAMARPDAAEPVMPFRVATFEAAAGSPRAVATLRDAVREHGDAIGVADVGPRIVALTSAANAASGLGLLAEAERLLALRARYDAALPMGTGTSDQLLPVWRATLRLAMGADETTVRRDVARAIAAVDAVDGPNAAQVRRNSVSVAALAFLETRDPRYLDVVRRWTGTEPSPESRALAALATGDTTTAMRLVRELAPLDASSPLGAPAPLRAFARAELFLALGDARGALGVLSAIDPTAFPLATGLADARFALHARSHLVRGQLHEQLGEGDAAAVQYARFLELWKDADPAFAPALRQARAGLARVRRGGSAG